MVVAPMSVAASMGMNSACVPDKLTHLRMLRIPVIVRTLFKGGAFVGSGGAGDVPRCEVAAVFPDPDEDDLGIPVVCWPLCSKPKPSPGPRADIGLPCSVIRAVSTS